MADREDGERKFFGNLIKNQTKKYGSTTKPSPKYSKYVRHIVCRVDTLMGIALKYGATVEQIKRENKLWTNDSLFLREHLHVPITAENSHLVQDNWEILSADEVRSRSNSDALSTLSNSMEASTGSRSNHDDSEALCGQNGGASGDGVGVGVTDAGVTVVSAGLGEGMDFLSKYDTNIASLKSKVEKMEQSSSHRDDHLLSLLPRRHSDTLRSTTRTDPRRISLDQPDSPVLVIRSNTRAPKVQTAMKRSEQANECLFEL